jgi:hypothetical protein
VTVASGPERHEFWPPAHERFGTLLDRLHLVSKRGIPRWWWLVAFTWLPLVGAAALRLVLGERPDPIAYDISVHVRLVIALPLMMRAESLLAEECRGAVDVLYDGAYAERARLDRAVDRAERLRRSRLAEIGLIVLALLGGQLALWGVVGQAGAFHGGAVPASLSFSRFWYAFFALPIFQFVMFRWLWRWLVWTTLLARIARLRLALIGTHPDHAAGLAPLSWPVIGFTAFVFAIGTVLSGAWGSQLLEHRVTLPELLPGMLAFLVLAIVVACGPLLLFCGHLFRARARTLYNYGRFALGYVRDFDRKWIEHPFEPGAELGTSDLQSLNDLDGAFGVAETTRLFVFSARRLIALALAAALPMLPLFVSTLTVERILKHLLGGILGGIPI